MLLFRRFKKFKYVYKLICYPKDSTPLCTKVCYICENEEDRHNMLVSLIKLKYYEKIDVKVERKEL